MPYNVRECLPRLGAGGIFSGRMDTTPSQQAHMRTAPLSPSRGREEWADVQTERVYTELREIARRDVNDALRVWDLGLSPDGPAHPVTHPALNYGGVVVVPLSPDRWVVMRKPEPAEGHVMCCPGARVAHTMATEDVAQVLAA